MVKLSGRAWKPAPTAASTRLLAKIYGRGWSPVAGGHGSPPLRLKRNFINVIENRIPLRAMYID